MNFTRRTMAAMAVALASLLGPLMASPAYADPRAEMASDGVNALHKLEAIEPRSRFFARHFFRALLQGRLFRHRETLASALMTIKLRHDPARRLDSNLLTTVPFGRRTCWGHGGFWGSAAIYCPDIDVAVSLSINQATPADPEALHALVLAVATEIEHTEAR